MLTKPRTVNDSGSPHLYPWHQNEGKGARFEGGGVLVHTPTFLHTTEENVTAFLRAGFGLDVLCEPRSPDEPET